MKKERASMVDVVKLSTRVSRPSPLAWYLRAQSIFKQKENIIDCHLFSPMKEDLRGKHYVSNEEVKIVEMKWLKTGIHSLIQR